MWDRKKDNLAVKKLSIYIDVREHEWMEFIKQEDNPEEAAAIKKQTMRGRPVAGTNFTEKLEKKLKRGLIVKTKGRPEKIDKSDKVDKK